MGSVCKAVFLLTDYYWKKKINKPVTTEKVNKDLQ